MITSKWKMKKGSIHHQQKKIVPDENKKILEIQSRKVGKNLLRDFFFWFGTNIWIRFSTAACCIINVRIDEMPKF